MPRRPAILALSLLLAGLVSSPWGQPAQAAPLAALTVGVAPASGPPGLTVTVLGSGWTFSNSPYKIFWDTQGGTELGTFSPNSSGSWSTSVTIPGGAGAGPHAIIACEGWTTEFQGCASTTFTVLVATATRTRTPTRTPSRTPTAPPPGYVTPTYTLTPTSSYLGSCIDGVARVSPENYDDTGGVLTVDLVMDVVLTDPTTQHLVIYEGNNNRGDPVYTQWPDPLPGTTVEAVPDASQPNRWRVTVRNRPIHLGYNQIGVSIETSCSRAEMYFQFNNGPQVTGTPRPDACGGLGLSPDATVITFDSGDTARYLENVATEQGVRFEGSVHLLNPRGILPRSGWNVAASVEGLEFGSTMLPIRMAFDRPLQAVGVFVGLENVLYVSGEVRAVLSTYGYRGASTDLVLLGSDVTSFPAAPTDVIHCLRYAAAKGSTIVRALVEYTDAAGNSIAERRMIDDLTLVYADAELPPDRPPTVEITGPADGASIPSTTVYLRASIQEDRELGSVHYQIDGGPEIPVGAAPSMTDPTRYTTGVNFSSSLLTPGVPHLLTVTAIDAAGQLATDSVTIQIPTPVPTIDVQAVKMEVVQVIQCLDNPGCFDNAVPMMSGKPTWVRLYVRSEGGTPRTAVSGRLCRGRVSSCDTGYVLPINRITPDDDHDPSVHDRGDLAASLNFPVPVTWLAGGSLEMTAFVNYREADFDETRTDNNAVQAYVTVIPARSVVVRFVPVRADGITADVGEMWNFADWLARVYPVTRIVPVSRAPLAEDFDLSNRAGGGCGASWNHLLDSILSTYLWTGPAGAHFLGLVPPDANGGGVLGCGDTPGQSAASVTSGGTRWGPIVAAQEIGHNFGRRHASSGCGAGGADPGYPKRDGLLDEWGIDLALRQIYPPTSSYDYMGYCGGIDNTWTSIYTYLGLIRGLPVAQASPSSGHLASLLSADGPLQLVGGGSISPQGFALEQGFYRASLPEGVEDGLPPGPFTVSVLDRAGGILYTRDFGLIQRSNDEPSDEGSFQIIMPDAPDAAEIAFAYRGAEIGRVRASPHAPQLRLLAPTGGEDWGTSGPHQIAWEATDADGDALRYNVQYSTDGGAAWSSLEVDLSDVTSLTVDSANLPGGQLLFRVLASDGLNQAVAASTVPVTVGSKAPLVHLASPVDGDSFPSGEAVVFRGYAADSEDIVLEDSAFRWTSDREGDLGQGPTLWAIPLSPGEHQITLTVTDRSGKSASQSVKITIGASVEAAPTRPPIGGLLLIAGGILVLGSAAGILLFVLRSRKT